MTRFIPRPFIVVFCISSSFILTSPAFASAFQIWEQDGASIGNYHAGYAAIAADASTAFYNPAGLTRFDHQQAVFGGAAVTTDFKFKGDVSVESIFSGAPQQVNAQGGSFNFVPNMHYVAPVADNVDFGLSVVVPFGLKSNYGKSTFLRYVATLTSVNVLDISPVLAWKAAPHFSLGAGPDIERMYGEFDSVVGNSYPSEDTTSTNKVNDTALGYHLGGLYEYDENTRVGLSYHSQVVHHLTGTSNFQGNIAEAIAPPGRTSLISRHTRVDMRLPAYTALSAFHQPNQHFALMGTVIYTQWNVVKTLQLQNVAGMNTSFDPTNTILVSVPQYFKNTFNVAVGANYYPTDTIILRGGLGYDQSPVQNGYRNVQLPDNNHYVVAVGSHFQATKNVGLDLSYAHVFLENASINPPPLLVGFETVRTTGHVEGGADVFGGQITWDLV